ncbi:hypothetical protein PRIPAC_77896 [Pristionchus pacificus]|uniref:Uncharacterized protein n=1 Tax=Pristionchus pacificus TaxID=54126 RepID=A0A2A6CM27_PRIPA|nr:hypothetical protein PRIPAC_77896 [Pristionchus pacificus]|eukprot:PDM79148.1 hypothetical protein PRIPAC_31727 [Pristionchus pacificus]
MCIEVCCEVLAQMCFASCVDNALTKQEVARQKEEEEERKRAENNPVTTQPGAEQIQAERRHSRKNNL